MVKKQEQKRNLFEGWTESTDLEFEYSREIVPNIHTEAALSMHYIREIEQAVSLYHILLVLDGMKKFKGMKVQKLINFYAVGKMDVERIAELFEQLMDYRLLINTNGKWRLLNPHPEIIMKIFERNYPDLATFHSPRKLKKSLLKFVNGKLSFSVYMNKVIKKVQRR